MTTQALNFERLEFTDDSIGDAYFDGVLFSGIAFEEDPNSQLIVGVYGYHLGKLHGPFRVWYNGGLLKEEEYRGKGVLRGPKRTWHTNGQIAESSYTEYDVTIRSNRWDPNGAILKEFRLPDDSPAWLRIKQARQQGSRPIIDIDLKTLKFFERAEGWGRNEADLPPTHPPPSLDLCRAVAALVAEA